MRRILLIGTIVMVFCATFVPTAYATHSICSESQIYGNILTTIIKSATPVVIDDTTPDYTPQEDTIVASGEEYDCIKIVNTETEGDGIAGADGNVDVHFTMNDSRPFFFAIHHFNGENSKLRIVITIDGVTTQYTSNISGQVIHYIGHGGKVFSLPTLINNEAWFESASEVTVNITNYSGHVPDNVTLSILFVD